MRTKKILFLVSLVVIIIITAFSFWFVSRIQVYGNIKVSYQSTLISEKAKIIAYTPLGREVIFLFNKNNAYVDGFYNSVYVELPCEIGATNVVIERDEEKIICPIDTSNFNKSIIIPFSPECFKNNTFMNKTLSFIEWLFSLSVVQDIVLLILAVSLLLLGVILYWKQIKINQKRKLKEKKRFVKTIYVFLLSLLFWTLVVILLFEIFLRIFGFFYSEENNLFYQNGKDDRLTILCIGDSFTYGIGATSDKSYPNQLKSIIEKNHGKDANVINAGVCAGNTTQMLENIQYLLLKHKPDVVVMLFGMANSWNYYGYSANDSFLFRLRTYKLVKRIIQNIDYKKNGFEMFQKVDDFLSQIRITAINHLVQKKSLFDISYYTGRYFLAKRNWNLALNNFAVAASQNSMNDSVLNALSVCINKIDEDYFYRTNSELLIQQTVDPTTLSIIDSLIIKYPESPDFRLLKYRYLINKGDSKRSLSLFKEYSDKYKVPESMYFDLNKIMTEKQLLLFCNKLQNCKSTSLLNTKAYLYLKQNNISLAISNFKKAFKIDSNNYYTTLGLSIYHAVNNRNPNVFLQFKNDVCAELCKIIYQKVYSIKPLYKLSDQIVNISHIVNDYFENTKLEKLSLNSLDSIFYTSCSNFLIKFNYVKEVAHEDFFLVHAKKRSMNIKEKEIFEWVEKDINTIIDICSKQGFPVICMNYPLIPPPSSEEISFWAANVGEIWKKTASSRNIPFINNDSIFSTYKDQKSKFFEPVSTGSEHCNELGYKLMAENVYRYLKLNNIIKTKVKK